MKAYIKESWRRISAFLLSSIMLGIACAYVTLFLPLVFNFFIFFIFYLALMALEDKIQLFRAFTGNEYFLRKLFYLPATFSVPYVHILANTPNLKQMGSVYVMAIIAVVLAKMFFTIKDLDE